jgi:hypothetical protein
MGGDDILAVTTNVDCYQLTQSAFEYCLNYDDADGY